MVAFKHALHVVVLERLLPDSCKKSGLPLAPQPIIQKRSKPLYMEGWAVFVFGASWNLACETYN